MSPETIRNYYLAEQRFQLEIARELAEPLKDKINELPFEMLSDISRESLTYYTKDLSFDVDTHHELLVILKTLRHYPIDQRQLSFWRRVVDDLYRFINFDILPRQLLIDFTDTFIAERLLVGIRLVVLYGTLPRISKDILCDALNFSEKELELFVTIQRFGFNPDAFLSNNEYLKSLVSKYRNNPFTFTSETFKYYDEGHLLIPIFICYLRSVAKRKTPEVLNRILRGDNLYFAKKGRIEVYTFGLHIKGYSNPKIVDDLLDRTYDVEEFKTIYGISD